MQWTIFSTLLGLRNILRGIYDTSLSSSFAFEDWDGGDNLVNGQDSPSFRIPLELKRKSGSHSEML